MYGHGGHIGSFEQIPVPSVPGRSTWNLITIDPVALENMLQFIQIN